MARGVAVIGGSVGAAQAALTLAELGVEVKLVAPLASLGTENTTDALSLAPPEERLGLWPLLLRAASHPLVSLYTNCVVESISSRQGRFTVRATRAPRYIRADLCSACGRCQEACSVQLALLPDGRRTPHSAVHAPTLGAKTIPSAYYIEKAGIAPCRAACPLGINVQGFVSLLSKGKVDEALNLITEAAPLAGVLGRVCTHPCEDSCKRNEVDSPVFIQALHRYAADNAPGGINYTRKVPSGVKRESVAIIGSGPAGLAAAWELARRGYRPTIFESHAVVGGMLATGIPRFRLPREVREREVEAIRALGVDIKTGVTVGRDVTIGDLRERGYRAFFLAIGAHQNNKLNIRGEDLEGVVDGMSLLFALNLRVGTSVGSSVVVVGGGNSAVDAARTANRRSKGAVRVLCIWEDMTAVREDVEEAIREGVIIEYRTAPVEILGDGGKVTGVRCQRTEGGDLSPDSFCLPQPVAGTDFVIDADQVVVAIGQRPNTAVMNITGLDVNPVSDTIRVDPLTLETSLPGIFAGGDCATGSNNVVEAVAAGLRAAQSMDRYLRGRDMRKGRTLEKPQPVDIDIREREVSYHKRARMPGIPLSRRAGKFEETALGLPPELAEREATRCLNCALCSECRECERVCELGAVFHQDSLQNIDIPADLVIDFTRANGRTGRSTARRSTDQDSPVKVSRSGVYTVELEEDISLESELARATAAALKAAIVLKPWEAPPSPPQAPASGDLYLELTREHMEETFPSEARIGVTLCRCGGSISSVVDFNRVTNEVLKLPGVCIVQEIPQACTEEGAGRIANQATEWNLDRVVLAACRCCGLEQICFSCTDRRVMCRQNLNRIAPLDNGRAVEFVNIREQCAWVHPNDPEGATNKAIDMVSSAVARIKGASPREGKERPVAASVLVLGTGLSGLAAARDLLAQGVTVSVISGPAGNAATELATSGHDDRRSGLLRGLEDSGVMVKPWPRVFDLQGCPGSYEALLRYESEAISVSAGAVVLNRGESPGEIPAGHSSITEGSLLHRLLSHPTCREERNGADSSVSRSAAINETAGVFVLSMKEEKTPLEHVEMGAMVAARASAYVGQGTVRPRSTAVTIDDKLCRGCGDCAAICSLIEMTQRSNGTPCAHIDAALCLGCGACIAQCPTGAITQPSQGNQQLVATLEALWATAPTPVPVK